VVVLLLAGSTLGKGVALGRLLMGRTGLWFGSRLLRLLRSDP
jgi:hypothetical protein